MKKIALGWFPLVAQPASTAWAIAPAQLLFHRASPVRELARPTRC